ncbi:hypothetical protein DRB96_10415 [Streptomyces sp. ICC1]|nr:hypothetical protein DRB89_25535 [Streptomyces sp. ICC4]AWZ12668.1 hypothetical protein DRB96_10415 [Streptomyces sp. ICC1]
MRHYRVASEVWVKRSRTSKATPVVISLPAEQRSFIAQLKHLIEMTGLEDEMWLLFGPRSRAVARYLSGQTIPKDAFCYDLAFRLADFLPEEMDAQRVGDRLMWAAGDARVARARERRVARLVRASGPRAAPAAASSPAVS